MKVDDGVSGLTPLVVHGDGRVKKKLSAQAAVCELFGTNSCGKGRSGSNVWKLEAGNEEERL